MQSPPSQAPPWGDRGEVRASALAVIAVLASLTLAKGVGAVPYLGPAALTGAAFIQLYLPVWRADRRGAPLASLGLCLDRWRADARPLLALAAVCLPAYAVGYHLFVQHGVPAARAMGLGDLAPLLPRGHWSPQLPTTPGAWLVAALWLGERIATHTLGVALPEETFYRGYLQPCLEWRWPPRMQVAGTGIGGATVAAATLFALGHFLGEWNPLRLGPFFPALLFAWQRNRTGSVAGAIALHASFNVFAEVWTRLYIYP
jgi:membrane protease YdiL (CAAX protease family)